MRVPVPFQRLDHHGLVRIGAGRILRSDLHAIEHPQVVELPLRLRHVHFAQRPARLDLHLPRDDSRPRVLIAGEQDLGDARSALPSVM